MKIKDIAFTGYSVTDIKRARKFYGEVLGLKETSVFEADGMAFVEYEIGSGTLSIGSGAENFKPGPNGGMVAFEVEDFEAAVAKLKAEKVKVLMDAMDTGACHMVIAADPDGNCFMIHKKK
ncbi:MAG TPA: VOC family protein [Candidatus Paceibacterota bacterium]